MSNLKYIGYSVVFQEVPDEVTLAINISGCPHHCEGCHSQYLWEDTGDDIAADLDWLLNRYNGLVTCVCFMGGDHNLPELIALIKNVRLHGLKTALYSGYEDFDSDHFLSIKTLCDYIKVGPFISALGGLNNPATNQIMYRRNSMTDAWDDITNKFQENNHGKD